MATSEIGQIKVISEIFVKPKYEVEASNNQPQHYLGPTDLMFLSMEYMQRGMLFINPSADSQQSSSDSNNVHNIESFLEKLNHSLSLCLVHFFPLAGRLATQKFPDDHSSLIFVDCSKGPGARILHATLDLNVSDLLSSNGHVSPTTQLLFDLGEKKVNHDGHTQPLLSIQVTELLDGIFIAFTMNHVLADGTSFGHFVSVLSTIFLSKSNTSTTLRKPIFKSLFPDGYGPILRLPYLDAEEFVTRFEPDPLTQRIFHFSPASMATLKAKANQECQVLNISSFQALVALIWRSITRARKLAPGEESSCFLSVNSRPRFDPPFSEDYFGNFLSSASSFCTVSELLGHNFGWAAMMIHKSVAAQNDKAVRGFLEMSAKTLFVIQPGPGPSYYSPNRIVVGESTKFDIYGPQFGFGKASTALNGSANVDDGSVNVRPGHEGRGSVDLHVWLRPKTMSALVSDEIFMSYAS